MDPGSWAAYGQHYQRLGGGQGISPNPGSLPQPPNAHEHINELAFSTAIQRQDPLASYGTTPTSLLLPHHGLNISPAVAHADTSFSSATNLLMSSYESMIPASLQPGVKSHFQTALNIAPGMGLFKSDYKSEFADLRGGFVRTAHPPAVATSPNVMPGGTVFGSAGLFSPHPAPQHSWQHATGISTASPFGILPHEAVLTRGTQPQGILDPSQYNEAELASRYSREPSPVSTFSSLAQSHRASPTEPLSLSNSKSSSIYPGYSSAAHLIDSSLSHQLSSKPSTSSTTSTVPHYKLDNPKTKQQIGVQVDSYDNLQKLSPTSYSPGHYGRSSEVPLPQSLPSTAVYQSSSSLNQTETHVQSKRSGLHHHHSQHRQHVPSTQHQQQSHQPSGIREVQNYSPYSPHSQQYINAHSSSPNQLQSYSTNDTSSPSPHTPLPYISKQVASPNQPSPLTLRNQSYMSDQSLSPTAVTNPHTPQPYCQQTPSPIQNLPPTDYSVAQSGGDAQSGYRRYVTVPQSSTSPDQHNVGHTSVITHSSYQSPAARIDSSLLSQSKSPMTQISVPPSDSSVIFGSAVHSSLGCYDPAMKLHETADEPLETSISEEITKSSKLLADENLTDLSTTGDMHAMSNIPLGMGRNMEMDSYVNDPVALQDLSMPCHGTSMDMNEGYPQPYSQMHHHIDNSTMLHGGYIADELLKPEKVKKRRARRKKSDFPTDYMSSKFDSQTTSDMCDPLNMNLSAGITESLNTIGLGIDIVHPKENLDDLSLHYEPTKPKSNRGRKGGRRSKKLDVSMNSEPGAPTMSSTSLDHRPLIIPCFPMRVNSYSEMGLDTNTVSSMLSSKDSNVAIPTGQGNCLMVSKAANFNQKPGIGYCDSLEMGIQDIDQGAEPSGDDSDEQLWPSKPHFKKRANMAPKGKNFSKHDRKASRRKTVFKSDSDSSDNESARNIKKFVPSNIAMKTAQLKMEKLELPYYSTPKKFQQTSAHLPSMKPKLKTSIEDDLGFLADFAEPLTVLPTPKKKSPSNTTTSKKPGFLNSFLTFIGDEKPVKSPDPEPSTVKGRGKPFLYPITKTVVSKPVNEQTSKTPPQAEKKTLPRKRVRRSSRLSSSESDSEDYLFDEFSEVNETSCANKKKETDCLKSASNTDNELSLLKKNSPTPSKEECPKKEIVPPLKISLLTKKTSHSKMYGSSTFKKEKSVNSVGDKALPGTSKGNTGKPTNKSPNSSQFDDVEDYLNLADVKTKKGRGNSDKVVEPRRQSMRQCKQKTIEKRQEKIERKKRKGKGSWSDSSEEDFEYAVSVSSEEEKEKVYDSDSDPVWSPGAKPESGTGSDDEAKLAGGVGVGGGSRRGRPSRGGGSAGRSRSANNSGKKRQNDGEEADGSTPKKAKDGAANNNVVPIAPKPATPAPAVVAPKPVVTPINKVEPPRIIVDERVVQSNFQSGDFVIAIADLEKDIPTIWRIQGKSLLQKYESFEENGKLLYRNLSVYSGWTQNNRVNYQGIAVKFIKNNRGNCVVEYVRDIPKKPEQRKVEITVEIAADENGPSKECFEVFIQTLISQSLDVTFISEIIKENDEYFLCSVQEIDKGSDEKKEVVDGLMKWIPVLKDCIQKLTNCITESLTDSTTKCEICTDENAATEVKFTGDHYDRLTLQLLTDVPERGNEKSEFKVCKTCTDKITTYHRVHHLKFTLYKKCYQKVSDLKASDANKESHQILEECLRDIEWMTLLYKELLGVWNACDTFKK